MTDFLLRGSVSGDDELTVKQINDKINACLDWGRLRTEGITLLEAVLDVEGAPPQSWQLLADPGQSEIEIPGVGGGFFFVECYLAQEPYDNVINGVVDAQPLNSGALRVRLLEHAEPWMVRVIKP